jgi:predicted  nucleic acid-binding Zn-ribbon protein
MDNLIDDERELRITCPICLKINALSSKSSKISRKINTRLREENASLYQSIADISKGKKRLQKELEELGKAKPRDGEKEALLTLAIKDLNSKDDRARRQLSSIAKTAFNTWESGQYGVIKREISILYQTHPKCDGCDLLFGKGHLAQLTSKCDNLKLCNYCSRDLIRMGKKAFLVWVRGI